MDLLLRGCVGCALKFGHQPNVWHGKALTKGNHLICFRLQDQWIIDKWKIATVAWMISRFAFEFAWCVEAHGGRRFFSEHLNGSNPIQFLFTFSRLLSRCETGSCALLLQTENAFHNRAAPLKARPWAADWFTQAQVILSQEGGQDILVAMSSNQWLSGWLMSVVTYCTSTAPFSLRNSFQPTTNLSYLTWLCNTRLAFIVLAGKKNTAFCATFTSDTQASLSIIFFMSFLFFPF